jgi:RNA polymerase sigma-70 factor, ECF subfamily
MRYCSVTKRNFPGMQERSFARARRRTSGVSGHEQDFTQEDATGSLERKQGSLVRLVSPGGEPDHDDTELARAFSGGEGWAARAIWTRHAPMVHRLFERALGPDGDAEDLTQDVFLRTFAGLPALRDHGALRSFIYSVALRTLKWELRRRRVRRILHLTPSGQLPDLPVRAADSEARQLLLRFYALLEDLGANERTAFVLRHMEEFKLTEVAELMGVSLATVKRWISRGSQHVSALVEADRELSSYLGERGTFHAP